MKILTNRLKNKLLRIEPIKADIFKDLQLSPIYVNYLCHILSFMTKPIPLPSIQIYGDRYVLDTRPVSHHQRIYFNIDNKAYITVMVNMTVGDMLIGLGRRRKTERWPECRRIQYKMEGENWKLIRDETYS